MLFTSGALAGNNEPSGTRLVSGKVIDKQSGEALAGVKIAVVGTDTYCYTDMEGNYMLPVTIKQVTEISVDLVGYAPLVIKSSDIGMESDLLLNPR
jgi:hypothetical protein